MTVKMKIGTAAGLLMALVLGYYLGQGNTAPAAPNPMQSFVNCGEETSHRYTCSMHPRIERAAAGQCPACGMKLIEKALLPQFNPELVALSDAELVLAGVETQVVGAGNPAQGSVPVSGRLAIPPDRIRKQVAGLPGRIEELYVTAAGEYVEQGQPVAAIRWRQKHDEPWPGAARTGCRPVFTRFRVGFCQFSGK